MLEASLSSAPTTTAPAGGDADTFSRLHICPLDADLLKIVVPAAVLPRARNVSYHTIQTFPENRYGFVELPSADAEKIRKKFHGSTLRGSKMKVEKAKPEKIREPEEEEDTGKKRKKKSSEEKEGRSKKRKTDYNTVEGVLLPEDRKVKRGWTTTTEDARREKKSKKSKDKDKAEKKGRKVKSKYTDKEECLMKTVVPANAPTAGDVVAKNKNKKKKGKSKREVVVHEFENTTKFPSFLKGSADTAPAATTSKLPTYPGVSNATTGEEANLEDIRAAIIDAESDSDSDSSNEEPATKAPKAKPDSESSDEDSDAESDPPAEETKEDVPMPSHGGARPRSSGSAKNLSIQIPPSTPAAAKEVHPLEALYKKSKDGEAIQAAPAAAEPFSFFGGGGSDEEDEDEDEDEVDHAPSSQPPMTPYTKQDFEERHIRSAAPTPDTAHPSRMRMLWAPNGEDDLQEEEEEPESSPVRNGAAARGGEGAGAKEVAKETDFHSWFYENRREINRSWMDRRKAAKKERRQRDNRAKGR